MQTNLIITVMLGFLAHFPVHQGIAGNPIVAGTLVVERPTLINLGFEWNFTGDDNRNASVQVAYRVSGAKEWKEALPLLRLGGERIFREAEHLDYTVSDLFAGSILDLLPDTEYACRFTMTDPDGVSGEAVKTVTVRTRAVPHAAEGGRILHVYPPDWKGEKQEPAFVGLKQAYYGSGLGDWSVVSERKVQPGDIIEVHAGTYKANLEDYVDPMGIPFDGMYVLTIKATAGRPIVIRAAGDGEVIFDGSGTRTFFDVTASAYHIIEGITFRNADIIFQAGLKEVIGAVGLTIRNCRFEDVGCALTTENADSKDFYIADNVILGRHDRSFLQGWANPGVYGAAPLTSYIGIKIYGQGHVVCHNAVAFFHDGIDVSTYGTPDPEKKAVAIDIYNNDIHVMSDDFIEADGGVHNIRIMRNRGVNAAQCGLSAQPVFGGPAYFIRNVLYHIPTGIALKFMAKPAGLFVYHNTIIGENGNTQTFSNAHFRNNLFLGNDAPRRIAAFPNATAYSTFDYDGYRPNKDYDESYLWISPPDGQLRDYAITARDGKKFSTLGELSKASGLEQHGVAVDYDIFQHLTMPQASTPHAVYHAVDLDFRLKPSSKAVDAGVRLPNVNDGFKGKAPDLGAIEAGDAQPVYGPRGLSNVPFYR